MGDEVKAAVPHVETTTGEVVPLVVKDTSATAPIGEFFSTRSSQGIMGVGKWATIFAIVSQLVQVVGPMIMKLMHVVNQADPGQ